MNYTYRQKNVKVYIFRHVTLLPDFQMTLVFLQRDAEDEFDSMIQDAEDFMDAVSSPVTVSVGATVGDAGSGAGPDAIPTTGAASPPSLSSQMASSSQSFNDDQLSRMERNKRLAMEKRQTKLRAQQSQGEAAYHCSTFCQEIGNCPDRPRSTYNSWLQ